MPYISQEDRYALEAGVTFPTTPGELNFAFTRQIITYLGPRPNYTDLNAVLGVLEAVKLEMYRRMMAPYEDQKIKENGDVYPR